MSEFTSCEDCGNDAQACGVCSHQGTRSDMFIPKPKQKVIKLDEIVGTDIDCEFDFGSYNLTGKLVNINDSKECKYQHVTNGYYRKCRIRENHWFYEPHGWGKCPIPDGLEVVLRSKYGGEDTTTNYINLPNWKYGSGDGGIIAINVIGTAANSRYEWQKENDND